VTISVSYLKYVASLGRQDIDQQKVRLIANEPGNTMGYICEFSGMSIV